MAIGAIIDPKKIPNLNQILFKGVRIFEFNKPKTNNIAEIINDQILRLSPFIRGYNEINKKTTKKTNPKLLFVLIFTLFILTNNYCDFISPLLIPAISTGFFIASLLKGSPNS